MTTIRMKLAARNPPSAGYASPLYASALAGSGSVLDFPASGGRVLLRAIGKTGLRDVSGCYPVFSCLRPSALATDFALLPSDLVTLVLVPDPLLEISVEQLKTLFQVVRPLGEHYVVDLGSVAPSKHHRRKLRQAGAYSTEIQVEADPLALLDDWIALYDVLIEKAEIQGLRRFSRAIFDAMLRVPGTKIFTAREHGELLGADWYYVDGSRVYAHLSAYSEAGYSRAISYPLMQFALDFFRDSCAILDLGGVPGCRGSGSGLGHFKSGWSTHLLPSFVCGNVLDVERYRFLTEKCDQVAYFPLYRYGEYD